MEALRGVQVEGAVLVTTPQVGFCWLSELKKTDLKKKILLEALEQEPNFPIMILILLTVFYDCASLSRIN